jgi:hypothetical protein
MEKETLIQNLKAKVGEDDFSVLSQRSIDSIIDPILPLFSDDEKVTDETYTLPVNMLKSYIGQYRHDIAEGIKSGKTAWEQERQKVQAKAIEDAVSSARTKWEAELNPKSQDTTVEEDPKPVIPTADEITAKVISTLTGNDGALGKMNATLTDFINTYNQRQRMETVEALRSSLRTYLIDELGADREPVVNLAIAETKIPDNVNIEQLKTDVKNRYEARYKEFYGDMSAGGKNGAFGGAEDSVDAFNSFIKERQQLDADAKRDADAISKMLM